MKKLNNYESPEITIVELGQEDMIATSIGDTNIPDIDW